MAWQVQDGVPRWKPGESMAISKECCTSSCCEVLGQASVPQNEMSKMPIKGAIQTPKEGSSDVGVWVVVGAGHVNDRWWCDGMPTLPVGAPCNAYTTANAAAQCDGTAAGVTCNTWACNAGYADPSNMKPHCADAGSTYDVAPTCIGLLWASYQQVQNGVMPSP